MVKALRWIVYGLLFSVAYSNEAEWVKITTDEETQVFIQEAQNGRPMGVKGVNVATVRFEVLAEVLLDIASYPEWMEELKESSIIETKSDTNFLLYNYYDLPWPLSDRDIYIRVIIKKDIDQGIAKAFITREESIDHPPKEGVIRVPAMEGILTIRYIDRETTEGTFTEWFDMGGAVPQWIKDTMLKYTPSTVFGLVSEACKKPKFIAKGTQSPIKGELEKAILQGYLKTTNPSISTK